MQCQSCYFYNAATTQCRRNAPQPAAEGTAAAAVWPTVDAADWCGEFKEKAPAKAA